MVVDFSCANWSLSLHAWGNTVFNVASTFAQQYAVGYFHLPIAVCDSEPNVARSKSHTLAKELLPFFQKFASLLFRCIFVLKVV